jgi:hypothetical protein
LFNAIGAFDYVMSMAQGIEIDELQLAIEVVERPRPLHLAEFAVAPGIQTLAHEGHEVDAAGLECVAPADDPFEVLGGLLGDVAAVGPDCQVHRVDVVTDVPRAYEPVLAAEKCVRLFGPGAEHQYVRVAVGVSIDLSTIDRETIAQVNGVVKVARAGGGQRIVTSRLLSGWRDPGLRYAPDRVTAPAPEIQHVGRPACDGD